jgi:hypothetical protein
MLVTKIYKNNEIIIQNTYSFFWGGGNQFFPVANILLSGLELGIRINLKKSVSFHVTITLLAGTTRDAQVYKSKYANDSLQYVTVICKLGRE